jgi:FkbM family methyltransferase
MDDGERGESVASEYLLELLGEAQLSVVDVGSWGGYMKRFLPVAPQTTIIGFEPDEVECERVRQQIAAESSPWAAHSILPYAIGKTARDRVFYVTVGSWLSSLLKPNREALPSDTADVARERIIDTISLDDLYDQQALTPRPDFVKLDTQGSELEILHSSQTHILPHLLGVETEAEFVEQYIDQPRFSEVELFLREQGFELVSLSLKQLHPWENATDAAHHRPVFCDAVFLRGRRWLSQQPESSYAHIMPKLLVCYLLYGLFAEALTLAQLYADNQVGLIRRYGAALTQSWARPRWRLGLLRVVLLCLLRPTRARRLDVARRALAVYNEDGVGWFLRNF